MTPPGALARLHRALDAAGASRERRAWLVPGRIEVLGKHTDYAGGRSLVCATERGLTLVAAPRLDPVLEVLDLGRQVSASFPLVADLVVDRTSWVRYPGTVARRLARDFPAPGRPALARGVTVALLSDLPSAAGVSSSSALVAAFTTALLAANELTSEPAFRQAIATPEALATYLGAIESGAGYGALAPDGGVGTTGGSQDPTAILLSQPGELGEWSFRPVRQRSLVTLPAELTFLVAASGVRASKGSSARDAFNRLASVAAEVEARCRLDARADLSLGAMAARAESLDELRQRLRSAPGAAAFSLAELEARLEQFWLESQEAVPGAAAALGHGDLGSFARWVERSVEAGQRGLANQPAETLALARLAVACGALAASPFGAGFGGSVWALAKRTEAPELAQRWRRRYLEAFPHHADAVATFTTGAGAGLRELATLAFPGET